MYLLFGIIFIIAGLVMLIKPDLFYEITEGWKNSSVNTYPSDLYVKSTRFGGGIVVIVGIAAVVMQFILWFGA